eukprot:19743-Chlamydomonas_euryale.AAC.1
MGGRFWFGLSERVWAELVLWVAGASSLPPHLPHKKQGRMGLRPNFDCILSAKAKAILHTCSTHVAAPPLAWLPAYLEHHKAHPRHAGLHTCSTHLASPFLDWLPAYLEHRKAHPRHAGLRLVARHRLGSGGVKAGRQRAHRERNHARALHGVPLVHRVVVRRRAHCGDAHTRAHTHTHVSALTHTKRADVSMASIGQGMRQWAMTCFRANTRSDANMCLEGRRRRGASMQGMVPDRSTIAAIPRQP